MRRVVAAWVERSLFSPLHRSLIDPWCESRLALERSSHAAPVHVRDHVGFVRRDASALEITKPIHRMANRAPCVPQRLHELLADAKRSTSLAYMASSHHKMRGYIADRPDAVVGAMHKAIVVCTTVGVARPRAEDEVVFVGVEAGGHVGDGLGEVVERWWSEARAGAACEPSPLVELLET